MAGLLTSHPQHTACFSELKAAQARDIQGFISTHTLAEAYSVLTRIPVQPRIKPDQAQSLISDLAQYLTVIPLIADDYQAAMVFDRPLAIARMVSLSLPGGGIFDALIAQAVLKANVDLHIHPTMLFGIPVAEAIARIHTLLGFLMNTLKDFLAAFLYIESHRSPGLVHQGTILDLALRHRVFP